MAPVVRRRLGTAAFLVALVAFVAEGCVPDAAAQARRSQAERCVTVECLRADIPGLERLLRECAADPGALADTRACRNAHAARLAYTADRLRRQQERNHNLIPVPARPVTPANPWKERRT